MIGQELPARVGARYPKNAVQHEVPDFVRDRVEIEREGLNITSRIILAQLEETVTRLRVIPAEMLYDLEPLIISSEEPGNLLAEIVFTDVEHLPGAGIGMSCHELAGADCEMVEMAVGSGLDGRM